MKIILAIIIVSFRIFLGIQILKWIILKVQNPQLHNISEIELYIVGILFDTWVSSSHGNIEIKKIEN